MTGPTNTTKQAAAEKNQPADAPDVDQRTASELPTGSDGEVQELARTQEDVAQRARQLVAGELVRSASGGTEERRQADRVLEQARAGLLAELRDQEQERARRQLQEAARSGEDAVAGVVQSITTIVRGIVPAALVRPEDVIEATFALADQGLRISRRLALTTTSSVRSLSTSA
ncbi:hypothetical protein O2W18_10595 [Modestobacter sp. VKM Ac-2983]|uniref:hypothetical protein n=1 Tax=Modestobacter sp. VKM Ac-2983 TaxID=3004137 RepID=UPI0022AB5C15|nr:hypothetical protein [Modestobacter sp. VKM Ac-2983]MCZ2805553.1 hypothetical protein [Modestobacter sp. VKM Ac-2983]